MMMKVSISEDAERLVEELTRWIFGDYFPIGVPEQRVICANALKLGLEQMAWEMEQAKAQEGDA